MKIGIMQPYFFPYIGYWQLIHAVDTYVVYDDVAYIKSGWINRNNILLNGQLHLITLALESVSSFKNCNEIHVTKNEVALNKLIKTLYAAYAKAPYFDTVMPMIENLLMKVLCSSVTIAMLNYHAIIDLNQYLDIRTNVLLSSTIEKDNSLKAQDKVIHINKILGACSYYNAIGGQNLYNKNVFEDNGLRLHFLRMNEIAYRQFKNAFIPNLSIIDVLMFNSVSEIQDMLHNYTLF